MSMDNEMKKMNAEELGEVAGGAYGVEGVPIYDNNDGTGKYKSTVTGLQSGWLALRSEPGYNASNEIGQLYNGDKVEVLGEVRYVNNDFNAGGATKYIKVKALKLGKIGWVNASFIA